MKEKINISETKLSQYIGKSIFDKAYAIACHCHRNDYRRDGQPYINHLIRVAERVAHLGILYVAVALLHDSVEDGHITLDELALEGFNEEIRQAIDDLSRRKHVKEVKCCDCGGSGGSPVHICGGDEERCHRLCPDLEPCQRCNTTGKMENPDKNKGESYFEFIIRVLNSKNPYSKAVKIADLKDNMSDGKEGSQLDKYRLACYVLETKTDSKAENKTVNLVKITRDGKSCTMTFEMAMEEAKTHFEEGEVGDNFTWENVFLSPEEFSKLPEFSGW